MYRYRGIEYPALRGKTIKQVRFIEDDEFTALIMEFEDNTRARFTLKTRISFAVAPEIMGSAPNGDLINCKRLGTRSIPAHRAERTAQMAAKKKTKYLNAHRGCPGGPKCHHCTWDSMHISVDGPHAKYIKGHRGQYRGDIDGAIDDFLVTLKLEARRLLRECAKETPALRQFHLNFG